MYKNECWNFRHELTFITDCYYSHDHFNRLLFENPIRSNSNCGDGKSLTTNTSEEREFVYNNNDAIEKKLVIFYTNADSLNNKMSELTALIQERNFQVVCISETLPKNLTNRDEYTNFELPGFVSFHNNMGRGVSIYIDEKLKVDEIYVTTKFEIVWVKLIIPNHKGVITVQVKIMTHFYNF